MEKKSTPFSQYLESKTKDFYILRIKKYFYFNEKSTNNYNMSLSTQ